MQDLGALPTQVQVNPNHQFKAITLRTKSALPNQVMKEPKDIVEIEDITHEEEGKELEEEKKTTLPKAVGKEEIHTRPLYPNGLTKNRVDKGMRKFLKTYKKLEVNISFVTKHESSQDVLSS